MKASDVAIAAPHPLAVDAAEASVRAGGNALDAALAAAVMLAVVYPHQCALGGDLTALARLPNGDVVAVLSLGAAPLALDSQAVAAAQGQMPVHGPLSVTVPGVLAGWTAVAKLGAVLELRSAFQRAASVATRGTEVAPGLAAAIQANVGRIGRDPGLSAVFRPGGRALAAGDTLRQPALGATLEELAEAPDSLYRGAVARRLAKGLSLLGSLITVSDLEMHAAELLPPLRAEVGQLRWSAAPPPSQGATALALLSGSVDRDLVTRAREAHRVRDAVLGDPRGGPVDVDAMLQPRQKWTDERPVPAKAGDTVAVAAVDHRGWSVALIQSVFHAFGAGMLDPATGILFHNRGAAFRLTNDSHDPARLVRGRRPPHTLCPLLGEMPGLRVALGSQGGWAQPLILAQVALRAATPSTPLDDTLTSPRWILGDSVGLDSDTVLQEPGAEPPAALHAKVVVSGARDSRCGHVQVARAIDTGLEAASDPRADGCASVIPSVG